MSEENGILGQVGAIWRRLGVGQRVAAGAVVLAVFGGIVGLTFWAGAPSYKALPLDPQSADVATVLTRLDEEAIDYRVLPDGKTVLVAEGDLEQAQRILAQGGLIGGPEGKEGGSGMFSGSGPMNRSQQEWENARKTEARLETALERFDFIDRARVVLTPGQERYFRQGRTPAKASVQIETRGIPSEWQIQAITHVVTGGVEKLSAAELTIQDMQGTIFKYPDEGDTGSSRSNLAYRRKLETEKARQAQDALDFVYGVGKTHVTVAAEIDWTKSTRKQRTYDPEKSVTRHRTKAEESRTSSRRVPGGSVGSRVPAPEGGGGVETDSSSTTTESKEFDVTETELVKMGGEIRRLSAAVFVDESLSAQSADIEKTLAAAIGLDPAGRGDAIAVQVAPIHGAPEPLPAEDPTGAVSFLAKWGSWIETGLYVLLGAGFLLFGLRTLRRAQASIREVLETSLEEKEPETTEEPAPPLEETVLAAVRQNTDLAGRTLKRWLYEVESV